jgi:hypothetical protein
MIETISWKMISWTESVVRTEEMRNAWKFLWENMDGIDDFGYLSADGDPKEIGKASRIFL